MNLFPFCVMFFAKKGHFQPIQLCAGQLTSISPIQAAFFTISPINEVVAKKTQNRPYSQGQT